MAKQSASNFHESKWKNAMCICRKILKKTENVSVYSKLIGKDSLNMLFITEKGVYILPEYSGQMIFLSELPENMSTNEADYFDNLEALYINSRYDHAIWSYETL